MYQHTLKAISIVIWLVLVWLLAAGCLRVLWYLAPHFNSENSGEASASVFGALVVVSLFILISSTLLGSIRKRMPIQATARRTGEAANEEFQATHAVTRGLGKVIVPVSVVLTAFLVLSFLINEPGVRSRVTGAYDYFIAVVGTSTGDFVGFGCLGAVAFMATVFAIAVVQAIFGVKATDKKKRSGGW